MSAAAVYPANVSGINRFCHRAVDSFIHNTSQDSRIRAAAAYVIATLSLVIASLTLIGIPLVYRMVRIYIAKTIEAPLEQRMQTQMNVAVAQKDQVIAQKNTAITSLQNEKQMQETQVNALNDNLARSKDQIALLKDKASGLEKVLTKANIPLNQQALAIQPIKNARLPAVFSQVATGRLIAFTPVKDIPTLLRLCKFFRNTIEHQLTCNEARSVRLFHSLHLALLNEQMKIDSVDHTRPPELPLGMEPPAEVMERMKAGVKTHMSEQLPAMRPQFQQVFFNTFRTVELARFVSLMVPPPGGKGKAAMARFEIEIQQPLGQVAMSSMQAGMAAALGGQNPAGCSIQ